MYKLLFLLFCIIANTTSLSGQCLDKDSILKRISILEHSVSGTPENKLKELLGYDKMVNSCNYSNDSVYIHLLIQIGAEYYYKGNFYEAIRYTSKALQIIKTNPRNPSVNARQAIKLYYYLTIYCDSLKLFSQKNEAIDSCMANEKRFGTDYHYTCVLLAFRVLDLYFKGDYNLYAEYSALGETLTRKYYHQSDSMAYINFFINHRVLALSALKKFKEAEGFLAERKPLYLKTKDKTYLGAINYLIAQVHKAREDHEVAIEYLEKAFQYDSKTEKKDMSGEILNQIGVIYYEKLNQAGPALKYYNKALRYARVFDAITTYGKIANVFAGKKKFDSAYYFFQKAFDKIKPGINESDLLQHTQEYVNANTSENILNIVLDKGDAFLQQFYSQKNKMYLEIALGIYKKADLLLNTIKREQVASESKLFWRNYTRRLYEHAIEASYLSNKPGDAFYFFEKSRAVLLNDQLNEKRWVASDELIKLAQVKKRILQTDRELKWVNPSSPEFTEMGQQQFANKQELERIEQIIKKQNPLYYQSILDTGFLSIQDVRKNMLKNYKTIIELFTGDSAVYVLFITADNAWLKKVNKNGFDVAAGQFATYLSDPALLNREFNLFVNTSHELYNLVFQNNPLPKGKVIISPDGQYFPFESLVTSKSGEPVNYFINDHAVSYTYSARFLLNDFYANTTSGDKNFMGFAPVNYPAPFSLAALGGSDHSLTNISQRFGDAVNMITSEATKSNFLQQFYKYKIIQLYTHASDSSRNNEPVIYFADSALYLSDLIGENKPLTRLVVLSACETGVGKNYKGEGVFSFNRGFAALGIPSSVTNLWTVDNESTYKLTEFFYKYVADGLQLDEALQKAKLEFIRTSSKEKQLPYYWASAVLVGNTERIQITGGISWAYYATVVGVPVLFFTIFMMLKRRKKRDFIPFRGRVGATS